ncbi:MAG: hypothetical protein LC780_00020 [Acidobacteria bacterium]|nr:hypothetical protein [Acidobacteriota bacterium]
MRATVENVEFSVRAPFPEAVGAAAELEVDLLHDHSPALEFLKDESGRTAAATGSC